uniref:Uncharacterized protein n=1 Tax=Lotharella oceanica TaxID=641309 RepID=A0A7S2TPP7_9EUKA|mmetsp:Transcript_22214/g.41643  ORF Transcript_22214/g.41643 Transcript_22214/m.41643 type:complete len:140 (+) Transcript_22214:3-422(+)
MIALLVLGTLCEASWFTGAKTLNPTLRNASAEFANEKSLIAQNLDNLDSLSWMGFELKEATSTFGANERRHEEVREIKQDVGKEDGVATGNNAHLNASDKFLLFRGVLPVIPQPPVRKSLAWGENPMDLANLNPDNRKT